MPEVSVNPPGTPDVHAPIGVFDSGFGGLTVARAIVDLLPGEDMVYLGDTARAPYGPRPIAEVREFALQCLDRLVAHGVKLLVIACNTASAAVLHDARERYDVPIVEVVLPAARRAAATTRNRQVGVICTRATATSRAYDDALAIAPEISLTTQVCPRFVEFVENGITGGDELLGLAREYLAPIQEAGVDTLILGCTHYPLLSGVLNYVLGGGVTLVSSATETAEQTWAALAAGHLLTDRERPARRLFLTTGDEERFSGIAGRLTGGFVQDVSRVHIG
ncbi:Glutamate racemase [Aestuariimicrobium sp. T2.26MG-19.2B]|nr:Glutamate racemase [Aestuariimicrobium sp. T2.26MG-19.2B]